MAEGPIAAVWIEVGCIACSRCEAEAPEVFSVTEWSARIRGEVRGDDATDENPGRSPLLAGLRGRYDEAIAAAAEACPVEVIRFERGAG